MFTLPVKHGMVYLKENIGTFFTKNILGIYMLPSKHIIPLEITDEFQRAMRAIANKENTFIEGGAGTGKSTFIKELYRLYCKKYGDDGGFIVLTPTGVSAIVAGGQTIHSFFRFFPSNNTLCSSKEFPCNHIDDLPTARVTLNCNLPPWLYISEKNRNKRIKFIVIDEISMVRADLFDTIVCYLRKYGPHYDRLAGGVQLCLVGDTQQLSPILKKENEENFNSWYPGVDFYNSKSFNALNFTKIEFYKNFRQKDDILKSVLNDIRAKNITLSTLLALNSRTSPQIHENSKTIILKATRIQAEKINNLHISSINNESFTYQSIFYHKNPNFDFSIYRAPQKLVLKVDARVMIVANNLPYWANGSIGTVVNLEKDVVTVLLDGKSEPIQIGRKTWEDLRYDDNGNKELKLGEYIQFPLMLGKAVTIHKSQGMSVDSMYLDLSTAMFAKGQLYVALSRCRTLQGLQLSRQLSLRDFM